MLLLPGRSAAIPARGADQYFTLDMLASMKLVRGGLEASSVPARDMFLVLLRAPGPVGVEIPQKQSQSSLCLMPYVLSLQDTLRDPAELRQIACMIDATFFVCTAYFLCSGCCCRNSRRLLCRDSRCHWNNR